MTFRHCSLLTACIVLGLISTVTPNIVNCQTTPAGCPTAHDPGFTKNQVVKYTVSTFTGMGNAQQDAAIQAAARAAFAQWTSFNAGNDSKVSFVEGEPALIEVKIATQRIRDPQDQLRDLKAETTGGTNSQTNLIMDAVIKLDLKNFGSPMSSECGAPGYTAVGACKFWDATGPNFAEAVKGTIMHEIGHLMGLNDVRINQAAGLSIMSR